MKILTNDLRSSLINATNFEDMQKQSSEEHRPICATSINSCLPVREMLIDSIGRVFLRRSSWLRNVGTLKSSTLRGFKYLVTVGRPKMKATPKNVHFLRLVSSIYKVELTGKHSRKKTLGLPFIKCIAWWTISKFVHWTSSFKKENVQSPGKHKMSSWSHMKFCTPTRGRRNITQENSN